MTQDAEVIEIIHRIFAVLERKLIWIRTWVASELQYKHCLFPVNVCISSVSCVIRVAAGLDDVLEELEEVG